MSTVFSLYKALYNRKIVVDEYIQLGGISFMASRSAKIDQNPKIYDPNSGVIEEATPETYVEDVYAKNI